MGRQIPHWTGKPLRFMSKGVSLVKVTLSSQGTNLNGPDLCCEKEWEAIDLRCNVSGISSGVEDEGSNPAPNNTGGKSMGEEEEVLMKMEYGCSSCEGDMDLTQKNPEKLSRDGKRVVGRVRDMERKRESLL
ncbi:unnamed protein product [Allacma fusca]|uniref:Uncharacterized protein n=1 Tax=Allacma fusca TaxID=39272 RepID=A0A8J2NKS0_9HEXA|nr:unnamed protein product [Allacma fusca]